MFPRRAPYAAPIPKIKINKRSPSPFKVVHDISHQIIASS